jgi:hypothetical protein
MRISTFRVMLGAIMFASLLVAGSERCVGHGTLRQPVAVETHWTINNLRLR